jgi:serine protease AprX
MKRNNICSQLLIITALLVTLLAPSAGAGPVSAAKAHPQLLALAARQPESSVEVIVQKTGSDHSAETLVAQLGGEVLRDLSIINAFSAQMSAETALMLATSSSVRWVSLDAPVVKTASLDLKIPTENAKKPVPDPPTALTDSTRVAAAAVSTVCAECIDTTSLANPYIRAIGADSVWNTAPYLQGQGITVAVLDTGVSSSADLQNRVLLSKTFSRLSFEGADFYGHGSHVMGIVGGNGVNSSGAYVGVAPKANLINLQVSDAFGNGTSSNVVAALQWVYENHVAYNIRVVNISFNTTIPESYHTNPISAAAEILWFNGVVVVVSAGNEGKNGLYPPANDPFVITVGASNDQGTGDPADDSLATFSAYGTTADGIQKPDLLAPGVNIVSLLTNPFSRLPIDHPDNIVKIDNAPVYFRMSGTSMAAPVVSGAAALLLQDEPGLTPDQVKYRLMATARPLKKATGSGAGLLDINAAVQGTSTESANIGLPVSQLLSSGSEPVTWNAVSWNAVSWNAVSWNAVSWNAVSWNAVSWNSVDWTR